MLPLEIVVVKIILILGFPFSTYILLKGVRIRRLWWWRRKRTIARVFMVFGAFMMGITFIPFLSFLDGGSVSVNSEYMVLDQLVLTTRPELTKHLRAVDFTTHPINPEYYAWRAKSEAVGLYTPLTRTIFIPVDGRIETYSDFDIIWWHELGHHVWYYHMSAEQRDRFTKSHEESIAAYYSTSFNVTESQFKYGFVSDYAHTSISEDFAESFSYYIVANNNAEWALEEGYSRAELIKEILQDTIGCSDPECARIPMSASVE